MAGTFFNTGAAEFWGEMVNYSGNFENRSGSNVLLRIMKMTKKHEKWLIYKLKGFFVFFEVWRHGSTGWRVQSQAVSGKREVPAPLLVEGGIDRGGSDSTEHLPRGCLTFQKPPIPRWLTCWQGMGSGINNDRWSTNGWSDGWRDGEHAEGWKVGPSGF